MSAAACCGGPVERRHHPTARDHRDEYLDPDFTLSFCHSDHEFVHDDFKAAEIEKVPGPLTVFERVEIRMRRLAMTLAHVHITPENRDLVQGLVNRLPVWADALRVGISQLDQGHPDWKEDPGFYAGP